MPRAAEDAAFGEDPRHQLKSFLLALTVGGYVALGFVFLDEPGRPTPRRTVGSADELSAYERGPTHADIRDGADVTHEGDS